jgi:hippurate hydrolase
MAVFQPGEETSQGAKAMIDDGMFKRFPNPKTTNPARSAGGDGVVGTSLHRFLLRFRLRCVTSGTSVGTSTGSDGSGALACRLEWRSIQTQNPRQTAVMASTAIVAGSIVFSSCFDSPKPALLFTSSSVR